MTFRWLLGLLVAIAGGVAFAADPVPDPRTLERALQRAFAKVEPTVACVVVSRRTPAPAWRELTALEHVPEFFGSGVVIDHRLVLTCYHVVRDASTIAVRLPPLKDETQPRTSEATIYAADVRSDLAVLKLTDPRIETPAVELGRGEELHKGKIVVVAAHPYTVGFRDNPTMSWGIISGLRSRLPGQPKEEERNRSILNYSVLAQTDARIAPGASGAALVDLDGKLVGLATTIAAMSGGDSGGFALPIDAGLRRVIDVLRRGEEVEYGFLGVQTDQQRFGTRRPTNVGVVLDGITPKSPAARAGLRPGDSILKVNGQPIRDYDDMFLHIGLGLAGRDSVLEIRRGNRPIEKVTVRLAKFYLPEFGVATNRPDPVHGLRVDYSSVLTMMSRGGFTPDPMIDGVVIRDVIKGSPADEAGLAEYSDVIIGVNGVATPTPADFYREATKAERANKPLQLRLTPDRTVTLP